MSKLKEPQPVKPIIALLYPRGEPLGQLKIRLTERLGAIDWESPEFEFNHTHYYTEEMGADLVKSFLGFEKSTNPENLPEIKFDTNQLESDLSVAGKRRVNIDPGYFSLDHLVIATGKNTSHRIYLGKGVYADLTLVFQSGSFRPLPWTYPDFRSEKVIDLFNKLRQKFKQKES